MTVPNAQTPNRPRKKPSQSRSRATYDAVLSAAAHILETRGVGALNTNAVAERAGVSIGSLYQYFSGKDAILIALMAREGEIFAQELARAADAAEGRWIGDDIAGLLRFGLSRHLQKPDLARLLEMEFKRLQPQIDTVSQRAQSRAAMIRLLIRHRPSIEIEDLDLAAQEIGVIARALMENAGLRGDGNWDVAIERTTRAILGYLGVDWRQAPVGVLEVAQ